MDFDKHAECLNPVYHLRGQCKADRVVMIQEAKGLQTQLAAESELLALANAQIERLQSGKSQIIDSLRQQVERQNNLITMQQQLITRLRSDLEVARKANEELAAALLERIPEPVDDEDDEEHP